MTAAVGHPTLRLVRIAIGPVSLGDLTPGQWRDLNTDEIGAMQALRDEQPQRRLRPKSRGGRQRKS
jgi:23S rRNA pseudouridine2457 synthase